MSFYMYFYVEIKAYHKKSIIEYIEKLSDTNPDLEVLNVTSFAEKHLSQFSEYNKKNVVFTIGGDISKALQVRLELLEKFGDKIQTYITQP